MTIIVAQIFFFFFYLFRNTGNDRKHDHQAKNPNIVAILGCETKYKDETFIWSVFSFAFSQFYQFLLWFLCFQTRSLQFATQATQVNNKDAVQIVCFRKKQCDVNHEDQLLSKGFIKVQSTS